MIKIWHICHYGVGAADNPPGRGSGRYPLGSGERPFQGGQQKLPSYKKVKTEQAHKIPKGTKIYRVMSDPSKDSGSGSTYVTYQKPDRNFYRAYIPNRDNSKTVYEKTYKLKEDLKIPSQDELKEVQQKVLSNKKLREQATDSLVNQILKTRLGDTDLDDLRNMKNDYDKINKQIKVKINEDYISVRKSDDNKIELYSYWGGETYQTFDPSKTSEKEVTNFARYRNGKKVVDSVLKSIGDKEIDDFQLASASLAGAKDVKNEIIKELKSRGYNAMVDEAGVGVMKDNKGRTIREGIEPLIIFDRENSLEEKKTSKISSKEIVESYRNYNRYMNKGDNRYRK